MKTNPRGIWATFTTTCHRCTAEIAITNGRRDPHECEPRQPKTLADIRAALDNR